MTASEAVKLLICDRHSVDTLTGDEARRIAEFILRRERMIADYQEAAATKCWSSAVMMDWACGHKGRGYCAQCHEAQKALLYQEIDRLNKLCDTYRDIAIESN